ncbi:hypothetical protein SAMN05443245_4983 [Paraburkholderia fungorum]|uniref:Uncharacterized protein n=2 Tax=Paraburkholderia fungorum TaxID=134537 RepID=A0A1H1ICG1_9BURK|nr:hypothetical protein SAMN05443245_4983 [Paraburkholderia fungorum]
MALALLLASFGTCMPLAHAEPKTPLVDGIIWQPDNAHADPHGDWAHLGAHELLVQWTAVDGVAFVTGSGLPDAPHQPDWRRIAGESWARDVIVGLAGRFSEQAARGTIPELLSESLRVAAARPPVHITGWYFPVEVDPTWTNARELRAVLDRLPRPLWISVYDRANIGGATLAKWLDTWLPKDVGVFLQDGVGEYAREPRVARQYADALSATLGSKRVRVIAEAFRPQPGGGFRAATADEIATQLAAYGGYRVYLFDGPHYVSDQTVQGLVDAAAKLSVPVR